jgi:hypothetical protein
VINGCTICVSLSCSTHKVPLAAVRDELIAASGHLEKYEAHSRKAKQSCRVCAVLEILMVMTTQ